MPLKGRQRHVTRLRKLSSGEINGIIEAGLYEAADTVRAEAHRSISAGSVSGKKHKPSKAGDPPHRDSGHLQGLIKVKRAGKLRYQVRSEAEYSRALEFGSSTIAARPFIRPARDAKRKAIRRIMEKKFAAFIKRSGQ